MTLSRQKPGRFRVQFGLRSILLLMLVVATVLHVFAPLPPDRLKLGGTFYLRTTLIPPAPSPSDVPSPQQANQPVEHGRWYLYAQNDNLVARGAYDRGTPTGQWEYFTSSGQLLGRGRVADGKLTGLWQTWDAAGHRVCQAPFEIRSVEAFYPEFDAAVRHGSAVWWSPTGEVIQPFDYVNGRPRQQARGSRRASDDRQTEGEPSGIQETLWRINRQLATGTFAARCDAIRRLRALGPDGVPGLIQALDCPEASVRRRSVDALQRLGEQAQAAIPRLKQMAESPQAVDVCATLAALVEIDVEHRTHWMERLFDSVIDLPRPRQLYVADLLLLSWPTDALMLYDRKLDSGQLSARSYAVESLLVGLRSVTFQPNRWEDLWTPSLADNSVDYSRSIVNAHRWWRARSDNELLAERIVELLRRCEDDVNVEIRHSIGVPLQLWQDGELRPISEFRRFGMGGGMF